MVDAPSLGGAHYSALPDPAFREARRARILLVVARELCALLGLNPAALEHSRLLDLFQPSPSTLPGFVGGSGGSTGDPLLGEEELPETELPAEVILAAQNFAKVPGFSGDSAPGATQSGPANLAAAHRLGGALDLLLASESGGERRGLGSYYTPRNVARTLLSRALGGEALSERLESDGFTVCDPACGGGAFLLEAIELLAGARLKATQTNTLAVRARAAEAAHGVDLSPLAVCVAEISLWLYVGDERAKVSRPEQFAVGDALTGTPLSSEVTQGFQPEGARAGVNFPQHFSRVFSGKSRGFDWIVGNPPWVAFQGRATQSISTERRAFYRARYRAFKGYPTLHGLFVERATELAPLGSIALLVPSSLSDLDGYRAARSVLRATHSPKEPLLEFGQDAFEGVVQPCFGLVAEARHLNEHGRLAESPERAFVLEERSHAGAELVRAEVPPCLGSFDAWQHLPAECFREMGFQSNRIASAQLFLREVRSKAPFTLPLLEGRNVSEFEVRAPALFLNPDREVLSRSKCRLRDPDAYKSVDFVVRQTASFTIAARHSGAYFRNSLIAGFAHEDLSTDLLLGLLNSSLYRALHLSRRRDARQAAFPQVKVAHLRSLPSPPEDRAKREVVIACSLRASEQRGLSTTSREALDAAVFALFGLDDSARQEVRAYLGVMAPAALRSGRGD